MKSLVKVLKAVSDPNRLKILKILQSRQMCVCEIQFTLELAQSSISKHLKILEEASLVSSKKDGLWVNYSLCRSGENEFAGELVKMMERWLEDDPSVEKVLKRASEADRVKIKGINP